MLTALNKMGGISTYMTSYNVSLSVVILGYNLNHDNPFMILKCSLDSLILSPRNPCKKPFGIKSLPCRPQQRNKTLLIEATMYETNL